MTKKETGLSTQLSKEEEAILNSYPTEDSFNRVLLPRLGMASQDVIEGKGKAMKVVTEAGTFFTDVQTDEEENGKKLWKKEEIGTEIEVIILYERKQLKFFDGEKYTSSPIYDSNDQIVPLFRDKLEVDKGTPAELKARKEYQGVSAKGKAISKLEDNKILYVLYNDKIYQMNLRGTSMYAFMTYKKSVQPNKVVTLMSSEAKENGAISWNQMTFTSVNPITRKETDVVIKHLIEIKGAIKAEQDFYASKTLEAPKKSDEEDNF